VDEHSQWFGTPTPGRLNDVFGLRTEEFYRPSTPPTIRLDGTEHKSEIGFYEVLKPTTATPMAMFVDTPEKSAAITVNHYGKGQAIYLAVPAQTSILGPLVRKLDAELGIAKGPLTPAGVYARLVKGRTLYVNSTGEVQQIPLEGKHHGLISGKDYAGGMTLAPYDADLVE
jgi:beta-galactosidase